MYERFEHTCYPIYNEQSKILILGTFPSVKSRETKFFYSHPQNRFWKLLARLTESENPTSIDEKKQLLLNHHIALWDVIASCDVNGSSDSSIKNVVPNDVSEILEKADIKQIFANGTKAYDLYYKYLYPKTGRDIVKLPSTSPANAMYQMDRLTECWSIINKYLNDEV